LEYAPLEKKAARIFELEGYEVEYNRRFADCQIDIFIKQKKTVSSEYESWVCLVDKFLLACPLLCIFLTIFFANVIFISTKSFGGIGTGGISRCRLSCCGPPSCSGLVVYIFTGIFMLLQPLIVAKRA
jgi:hypothetical protein